MNACKCGHPPATHIGSVGVCTQPCCDCDRYEQRTQHISLEAFGLVKNVAMNEPAVARVVQDLIDQRTGWEREAAKLLAQRDYAERRANDLETRIAAIVAQLRAVVAKYDDAGAAR